MLYNDPAELISAEWWLDRSQAWVHYIPVQVNYSDLYDLLEYVSKHFYAIEPG